tara:strand:+ start:383 stop:877 length:495 start_codon:yes stop_codon:yes gene_type:complete
MGGKNKMARIYLLEDINDNRYIGSTSELKLNCRLHTHRRDKKEMEMGKRKNGCSSALLDLHHCSITELKMVENIPELRTHWEKYYINNVYPECVNKLRYDCDKDEVQREYYEKNREQIIQNVKEYRKKNRKKYNKTRRAHYQKNKDKINKKRREKSEMKRLANL